MEDIFKFLLIAAVIVIGIVKQFKKEAKKNAGSGPVMPIPTEENPLPEQWGGETYGGYIPEGPKEKPVIKVEKKKAAPNKSTSSNSKTTTTNQNISPPTPELQENDDSEFTIHSAEEARRAIVWSEILQRKY